jgi:hypothetical protein
MRASIARLRGLPPCSSSASCSEDVSARRAAPRNLREDLALLLGGVQEVTPTLSRVSLYDPLIALDQNLEPAPGIAARWEMGDGGRTYALHLDPRATFSDGRPTASEGDGNDGARSRHSSPLAFSRSRGLLPPFQVFAVRAKSNSSFRTARSQGSLPTRSRGRVGAVRAISAAAMTFAASCSTRPGDRAPVS